MWKFKGMSVSFMHLPDAREQFAVSSSFPDLRLLLEDHHIVLSWNLTCSQELVLALVLAFLGSRSCGFSAPRSCVFTQVEFWLPIPVSRDYYFCLISSGFWKHKQAPSAAFRSKVLFLVTTPISLLSTYWRTTNISLPPSPFSSLIYCTSLHTRHQDIIYYM